MSISTLIRRMTEAGAPAEAIALAVEEIEALQAALDARRTADRDRKRAQRERQKSANVTGHSEENPETVTPQGFPEVSPAPLPNPSNPPLSPPTGLTERKQIVGRCLREAYPPPNGVSDDQWTAFRKQRKKALNQRSYILLSNKLTKLSAEGHDPGELIDLAIERGWETVFAPRVESQARSPPGNYLDHIIGQKRTA